jgi:transposase
VDVASTTLAAALPGQRVQTFARTPEGVSALAAACRAHGVDLLVMEATGGFEQMPLALLWAQGVPCALANPRNVRQFAQAMGVLEKADHIDPGVIARYAQAAGLQPQAPRRTEQERLRALVTRLSQLTALRVAQANQRRLTQEPAVLASIDEVIALVRRQERAIEGQIAALVEADPLWGALAGALRGVKGVASRTVARLLAELPEIGTLTGKAAAKLVGLAPITCESGSVVGRRRVRGGRAGVRGTLYVVAEIVRRHEPDFAAFAQTLIQQGKPKKVVRVALARKLLVRLNAKARDARLALPQPT